MKTGPGNPKQWSPPEDAIHSNGVETAPAKEWTPPDDAIPVKKKDESVDQPSENGPNQSGLPDWAKPSEQEIKPSGEPTLKEQIESAERENISRVQNAEPPKIEAGLPAAVPIKLGGKSQGLGEMATESLGKKLQTQQDARDFIANQNKKLLESIAEAGKTKPIQQDIAKVQPLIKVPETELKANAQDFQDKEAARLRAETKAKEEADNGLGRVSSAAGTFDQTVVNTFADILKTVAVASSETVGRLGLSGQFGKASDPTQDWAYQMADWVEDKAKEWFPNNPKFQGEILSDTLPAVGGTLLSFMMGGALGKTTKLADLTIPTASKAIMEQTAEHVPGAFMASASTAGREYDRALKETGDPDIAMKTWEKDMFTGLPFLVSPTFQAFNKATDGALKFGIKQFAQGGIAGGFQMGTSHAIENLSAQQTYDKTRQILDGVISTGGSGFAINGLLTGLLSAISHKAVGATGAEKAKYEQTISEIQEAQAKTKDFGNTDFIKEEHPLNEAKGDLGKTTTDVISDAKNEIKSSNDIPSIEAKAEEIIDKIKSTPVEGVTNDRTSGKREIPGEKRVGEEPVQTESNEGASSQEAGRDRIFQKSPEEEVKPAEEAAPLNPEATEGETKPVSDESPFDQTTTDESDSEFPSEQQQQNETTTEPGSNALPGEPTGEKTPDATAATGTPVKPPNNEGNAQPSPGQPEGSGIKKALVPEEKVAEMADQLENRTNEEFLAQGKKDVDSGEINPKELVDSVVDRHRALQTHEVAALVYYKAQIDNRFDAINLRLQKIKAEGGDPSEASYLKNELETLTQERDKFHEMQLITAREQGRAFGLRKMMLDNEYNLMSQINQYKAISEDGEIPPAVLEHFKEIDEKLKKANDRIAELERTSQQRQEQDAGKAIKERAKKERQPGVKRGKALIDEGFDDLKKLFRENMSTGITFDPKREAGRQLERDKKVVKSLAKIGRGLIDEGLATLDDVAQKLNEYIQDKFKGLPFQNYEKQVMETITAGLPRPSVENGKLKIPKSIIHDLVESGIDTIEDLTTAVHEMVKKTYPEVTERQVRDAITEYGKTVNLNQEEIATKIRGLKRVGKLISQLEDVAKKLRPLRSGLQRDALTDRERTMQRELRDKLKDLPEDVGENERVWKTAIEGVKSRLKNQITDLEDQIATGKKTPKKKGIVYDEEALKLQAKRDALRDQLQAIEGKPEISDEQRLRQAVTAAEKSLKDTERRVKEADFENTKKRTPVTSQELTEIKAKRDAAKEQLNKIREELGVADKERLAKAKEVVKKSQENYERRIREKDFEPKKKISIEPDKELETAILERDKAKYEFDVAQEKNRLANRPMGEKVKDLIIDTVNIPKSLISSLDLSAIFRQGLLLGTSHPGSVPKAMVEMVKKMTSERYNEDWIQKLRQSDIYPSIKRNKLYIDEPHAKLSAREENFVSRLVNKIPVLGSLVKGSQRAYTGYLNTLRVDVFAKGVDALKDAGYTEQNNPQAFKDWASFINNASGRGNLGDLERTAPILNTIFFSPRFLASRLNIMNPLTYAKMDPKVRQMAMRDTIKYIGFGLTVLGLAAAAGAEVEADPRSTDFGKIKIGNTRYDIWSGFQPIVRVIAQLISGQTKKSSGEIEDLKPGFGERTRVDVLGSFFRGKEAPTVSSIHNLLAGQNVIGEPVTPLGELEKNIIPLYVQDIANLYQSEGAKGVAQGIIPAMVGVGVQSYPSTGIEKDSDTGKVSANHDYYFSAPNRYSKTFGALPTQEQYNNFLRIRGEEIVKQFEQHKERLEKMDNQQYKRHMDHYVQRATEKAMFQAGIPEKSKHPERVEEEATF